MGSSLALLLAFFVACDRSRSSPPAAPSKPASEAELGRVTLTAEAEQRLGIADGLTKVQWSRRSARRLLGGEVMPVPGQSAQVVAPQAGTVQAIAGTTLPAAGTVVRAGQPLLGLVPLLGPTEHIQVATALVESEAAVTRAQAQDEAAELALQRATGLLADQVAGAKVLEDARVQREYARAALRAARTQRDNLLGGTGRPGLLTLVRVEAPITGTLREVRVALRQQVAAGTTLFDIVSDELLWVRVAVPSSELHELLPQREALIGELATPAEPAPLRALPVHPAPHTAQPQHGSVDQYFVVSGAGRFRLGQRVAVWLALRGPDETPVVPASAVVYDPTGGAWVYENTAPHVFTRRRVEVIRTEESLALLSPRSLAGRAPNVPGRIVTAGAMELYGAEFGGGK
jgi:multidrug efflux pump subunit AcrA (membrane-fusion protein)